MMHLRETFFIALHCMRAGRLRTALTMLGIVLSVAMVIAMSALNIGLKNTYHVAFNHINSPIIISSIAATRSGGNSPRILGDADLAALRNDSDPSIVSNVVPMVNGQAGIRRGARLTTASVIGSSPDYLSFSSRPIMAGSMFTDEQYHNNARVTLLGSTLASTLFDANTKGAVGSNIVIGRQHFNVIGVLTPAGTGDNAALMPMTTARSVLYGSGHSITGIGVLPVDEARISAAVEQINAILDREHYVKQPGQRDFSVSTAQATADAAVGLLTVLNWFTLGVTAVALFIGALGLANIMLITVTERTHEIGIRKAIGARRGVILRQFLIESLLIACIGGVIGVGLGVGLTLTAQRFLPRYAPMCGIPELSMDAVGIAFGISLYIGILAGSYPAIRAARLCPMDALRY
jgi:putative ABC transport system permease protein